MPVIKKLLTQFKVRLVPVVIICSIVLMTPATVLPDREQGYSRENISPLNQNTPIRWGLTAINAEKAWEITKGSEEIIIAIIDSGIDHSIAPLQGKIWVNEKEISGDNVDNDNNGYVDDITGWDFWDDDSNSLSGTEINYHGTFIAGIIVAPLDKSTGTGGVAPGIRLMDLRVLDDQGQLYTSDWDKLVRAIDYAVKNGAKIINLSIYSTTTPPNFVHDAIKDAYHKGVLVVGIPGNEGDNVRFFGQWEEVLTVGAIDKHGKPWKYSNHGSSVDLVAPGVDILSLTPGGQIEKKSGTSFAAAHITGAAALITSVKPNITAHKLREVLLQSAKDLLDPGFDNRTGKGLVDVAKALMLIKGD